MRELGKQLIMDLFSCNREKISDLAYVKNAMVQAALACGATIVQEVFHQFNPQGISGTIIIAESHFAIHTWPEHGYCALDLFTCGDAVNPDLAFAYLERAFEAQRSSIMEVKRGRFLD